MGKLKVIGAMVVMVLGLSCGAQWIGDDRPTDPESLFDEFWLAYDRYYAHFEVKAVDWDAIYERYRPEVDPMTTEEELFEVFGQMIAYLEDGHVYIVGNGQRALSNQNLRARDDGYDSEVIRQQFLNGEVLEGDTGQMLYGRLEGDIGYLRIGSLAGGSGRGTDVSGWVEEIASVVEDLQDTQAMVIDLRNNPGGRAFNAKYIAGFFAPERRRFLMTRSRSGPDHQDFSSPRHWYVKPHEMDPYTQPIVVLTNRRTFSAAEWLTLGLRQYDHVYHMGTHTGGGMAMFLPRELANGWMFTISVQDARCPEGRSYERIGIPPHRYLPKGNDDGRADAALEGAMEFLETHH